MDDKRMKIVPDKYGFVFVYADVGCVLVNEKAKVITTQFAAPSTDGWIELKEADAPDYSDEGEGKGSMTPDQAWKIIESSNISKENKQLLKDYIYKEG